MLSSIDTIDYKAKNCSSLALKLTELLKYTIRMVVCEIAQ